MASRTSNFLKPGANKFRPNTFAYEFCGTSTQASMPLAARETEPWWPCASQTEALLARPHVAAMSAATALFRAACWMPERPLRSRPEICTVMRAVAPALPMFACPQGVQSSACSEPSMYVQVPSGQPMQDVAPEDWLQ